MAEMVSYLRLKPTTLPYLSLQTVSRSKYMGSGLDVYGCSQPASPNKRMHYIAKLVLYVR